MGSMKGYLFCAPMLYVKLVLSTVLFEPTGAIQLLTMKTNRPLIQL